MEIFLQTTAIPQVQFSTNEIELRADGRAFCSVVHGDQKAVDQIIFDVKATTVVNPKIENFKLKGVGQIPELKLNLVKSVVGDLNETILEGLAFLAKPVLQANLNEFLGKGIAIPVIKHVQLVNPQMKLLQDTLQIETDLLEN